MKFFGITIGKGKKKRSASLPAREKHRKKTVKQKIMKKAAKSANITDDDLKILKGTKGKKATYMESLDRQSQIEILLAGGYSRPSIIQYCRMNFDIGNAQVDKYIAKIKDRWKETLERDHAKNLALAIKRRDALLDKTMKEKDHRTALSVLDSTDKLKGLFKEKIELSKGIADVEKDEIDDMLKAIDKKGVKK